ncbi:MAG: C10 family peptidase [Spirochaetaceae bacterium]|jgi:hypothetical protein|nr:C10 family peptidase [Spirochaetaceae bacterium]
MPPETAGSAYDEMEAAAPPEDVLTSRDYLALLKIRESHKVGMADLQRMATGVLAHTAQSRSVASAGRGITGFKKLPIRNTRNFVRFAGPGPSAEAAVETDPVEIYELSVGQPDGEGEGFVLASNDIRIGTILAIAEGSLEDANEEFLEVLTANLRDYIDATIAEYNRITGEEIEAALEKALAEDVKGARELSSHWSGAFRPSGAWKAAGYWTDFSIEKSPLLLTKWGQGSTGAYHPAHYAYNNYLKYATGNNDYLTGCGPTAMAQIIAYHNYINRTGCFKPAVFDLASVGNWSGTYDLSLIRGMPAITNLSSAAARGQVSALMYQLRALSGSFYDPSSGHTVTWTNKIKGAFEVLGYTVSTYNSAMGLTKTLTDTAIDYTGPAVVKNALNSNRPIFTFGTAAPGDVGHYWVIDGHGTMGMHGEYVSNNRTGQDAWVNWTVYDNTLMVHCNLGWDGTANGWYIYGIFDTRRRNLLESGQNGGRSNYSADTRLWIPKKP